MTIDRAAHLRRDSATIVSAAAEHLDAPVPSCPGWDLEKLIRHLGAHHRWVTASIEARDPATETSDVPDPDLSGDALIAWFEAGVEELAGLLETVPDDRPAWSWAGDHRKGFWSRRTTVETTIHRWDVENAVGTPNPLDPELAADGVDELTMVIVPGESEYAGAPGVVLLEATDTGVAWSIDRRQDAAGVSRGSAGADPDLRVAGSAEALLLCLWGRGRDGLEIDDASPASADLLAWLTA